MDPLGANKYGGIQAARFGNAAMVSQ
jgi:hypothetical protein